MKRKFYILTINIGSTSVKTGLFANREPLFKETMDYKGEKFSQLKGMDERLSFLHRLVREILVRHNQSGRKLDLIVSRGGVTRPLESGAYLINEAMCRDLREARYGWHPTNLGPLLAHQMGEERGVQAVIFDSPVTDEMEPIARISGLREIERKAAFHVLNQKSAARKAAKRFKKGYEEMNMIVAHLGGGITICAHRKGKIIDGTHGISEGPFTPQRSGALPLKSIIELCFSGRFKREELEARLMGHGGLVSYLGTHNIKEIEERIKGGDKEAHLIIQAMCYQIVKDIGAMATVLKGNVDTIVFTGNLCYSELILEEIKLNVSFLAPVVVFPGDDELENLASGGLGILKSKDSSDIQAY
jgi:butyrate kinase